MAQKTKRKPAPKPVAKCEAEKKRIAVGSRSRYVQRLKGGLERIMKEILLVGLGGFLGSVTRYKLGGLVLHLTAQGRFPFGTFTVNVLGCLLIGILIGVAERYDVLGPDSRLFLVVGLLGGFTTFSAFGLEAMQLLRRGDLGIAVLYAGTSVVLGIAAVWLGFKLVSIFLR